MQQQQQQAQETSPLSSGTTLERRLTVSRSLSFFFPAWAFFLQSTTTIILISVKTPAKPETYFSTMTMNDFEKEQLLTRTTTTATATNSILTTTYTPSQECFLVWSCIHPLNLSSLSRIQSTYNKGQHESREITHSTLKYLILKVGKFWLYQQMCLVGEEVERMFH